MNYRAITVTGVFLLFIFAWLITGCQEKIPETFDAGNIISFAEAGTDIAVSYEEDIQPFFTENCILCHGPEKQAKGLRLDSYKGVVAGASSGAVIIPGEPESSTLIHTVNPIRAEKIFTWIQLGAPNN